MCKSIRKVTYLLIILVSLVLILAACSRTKEQVGTGEQERVESGAKEQSNINITVLAGGGSEMNIEKTQQSKKDEITIHVDRTKLECISQLQLGITHTQHAINAPGARLDATKKAWAALADMKLLHNQHIMGWGALNPNPAPDEYDWGSLDGRIELIRSMGGTPVITLCASPDWMKGGTLGQTDWSQIEVAPLPEYYDDFAELCRMIAERYPDVKYYQVWNEFKGFWDSGINNWDYKGYTTLYNKVYDALKSVNPDIKVGGLYLVVNGTGSDTLGMSGKDTQRPITDKDWEVIDYWLDNKNGADFICIDRGLQDYHDENEYTLDQLMSLTHFFGDVPRQLRGKTDLPIWYSEYYGRGPEDLDFQGALYASMMNHMVRNGVSAALLWNPMQGEGEIYHYLFSDTRKEGGGQLTPHYKVYKAFYDCFGEGSQIYNAVSSSEEVEVIASSDKTMLINKRASAVTVDLDGEVLKIEGYGVVLVE